MLKRIHEMFLKVNEIHHQDVYDFRIYAAKGGWALEVTRKNKYRREDSAVQIFYEKLDFDNPDAFIDRMKAHFIESALKYAAFKKAEADQTLAKLKAETEVYTEKLYVLEEIKKI